MGTIADWKKKIAEYEQKDRLGTITKEERENWDFMQQKLDDWHSDYEVKE